MGVKTLARSKTRVSVLTVKPANIASPTTTELNAGTYATPLIPASLWKWGAGDPTTVTDTDLEKAYDQEVPVADSYDLAFGLYRKYLSGGGIDATDDALFTAAKLRGTTLYIYARKTDKLATAAWASADEIYCGGSVVTGTPKDLGTDGYLKYEIPLYPDTLYNFIAVA
jgi:hypothetical protein